MIEPDDKEMHRYNTIVTVTTDDIDNAERVLSERLTSTMRGFHPVHPNHRTPTIEQRR